MKSTISITRALPPGELVDPEQDEFGHQRFKRSRFTGADEVEDARAMGQFPLVECPSCHELVCGETLADHPCTPDEMPQDAPPPGGEGSASFYIARENFETRR